MPKPEIKTDFFNIRSIRIITHCLLKNKILKDKTWLNECVETIVHSLKYIMIAFNDDGHSNIGDYYCRFHY